MQSSSVVSNGIKKEFELSNWRFSRSNPLTNWLLLLAICFGAYYLYTLTVVPFVEVASSLRRADSLDLDKYQSLPDNTDHHRWFKPNDWELQPCSILNTAQGKILFDDYVVEDAKTWLVKPFSLVLEREQDSSDATDSPLPPLILRCATGARLNFDRPIMDKLGSSGNSLQSAFLQGKVELYRMETGQGKNDRIRIDTSNVQITNAQISTIDDVAFWFGPNQGIGRNLTIQLAHANPADSVTAGFSGITGIRQLELAFLTSLRLQPEGSTSRLGGNERLLSTDSSPIEITAKGAFEFDLQTNLARFVDHVQVRKLDTHGDTLRCHELLLQFKLLGGAKVIKLDAAADTQFELESITATGNPAILDARSQHARVESQLLKYDLKSQTIEATGREPIEIQKDSSRFMAQSAVYQLTNDKTLGPLRAEGPGWLIRDDGGKQLRATWEKSLIIHRESEQLHSIQLLGNTELQLGNQNSIRSDDLQFWIWEVPVFNQNNELVQWQYQPHRLFASDQVRVASEKMIGQCEHLVANWPANPQAAPQAIEKIGRVIPQPEEFESPAHLLLAAGFTGMNIGHQLNAHLVRRARYDEQEQVIPINVRGREINVVLEDQNQETRIVNLRVIENVSVIKSDDAGAVRIDGNELRLVPEGEELYQIRVSGTASQSAMVSSEQLTLAGPEIFLDQIQNSMWVRGAGRLDLKNKTPPVHSLVSNTNRHSFGGVADTINVVFDGGMVFDGLKVYFERQVNADIRQQRPDGTISETRANGNALSLTLDRRLDFRDLGESKLDIRPEIIGIILLENLAPEKAQFVQAGFQPATDAPAVITNQNIGTDGQITGRFTVRTPQAEVDNRANAIVAYGPGSVQIYRRGGGLAVPVSRLGSVADQNARKNPNGLTYIHTNFDRQLVANTLNNQVVVTGNLRTVYTPVQNFDQEHDPDGAGRLPTDAIRLNCERIVLSQSLNRFTGQTFNQFTASENAHIRSDTFDSTADSIKYDEQTDQLTVESLSGKEVSFSRRRDSKSDWNTIVVKKRLTYRVSDQSFQADQVGRISATIGNSP